MNPIKNGSYSENEMHFQGSRVRSLCVLLPAILLPAHFCIGHSLSVLQLVDTYAIGTTLYLLPGALVLIMFRLGMAIAFYSPKQGWMLFKPADHYFLVLSSALVYGAGFFPSPLNAFLTAADVEVVSGPRRDTNEALLLLALLIVGLIARVTTDICTRKIDTHWAVKLAWIPPSVLRAVGLLLVPIIAEVPELMLPLFAIGFLVADACLLTVATMLICFDLFPADRPPAGGARADHA